MTRPWTIHPTYRMKSEWLQSVLEPFKNSFMTCSRPSFLKKTYLNLCVFWGKSFPPTFPSATKKKRWKNRFPKWDFFSSQVEQRHLGTHVGATTGCQGGWQCWHHGLTSQWRFGNDHPKTSENGCFFTIYLRYFFCFCLLMNYSRSKDMLHILHCDKNSKTKSFLRSRGDYFAFFHTSPRFTRSQEVKGNMCTICLIIFVGPQQKTSHTL